MNLKTITQNKVLIYMVGGLTALIIVSSAVLFSNGNLFKGAAGDFPLWFNPTCSVDSNTPFSGDTVTWTANFTPDQPRMFDYNWTLTPYDINKNPLPVVKKTTEVIANTSSFGTAFPDNTDHVDVAIDIADTDGHPVLSAATCPSVTFSAPIPQPPQKPITISCTGTQSGFANGLENVTWDAKYSEVFQPEVHWTGDLSAFKIGDSVKDQYQMSGKTVKVHAALFSTSPQGVLEDTGKSADCSLALAGLDVPIQKDTVTCSVTPNKALNGDDVNWAMTVNGPEPVKNYAWLDIDKSLVVKTQQNFTEFYPLGTTSVTYKPRIETASGFIMGQPCALTLTDPPPQEKQKVDQPPPKFQLADKPVVVCSADKSNVNTKDPVTWKATLISGALIPTNYNYKFIIDNVDNGYGGSFAADGSTTDTLQSFNAPGLIKATVTVQNSKNNKITGPFTCTPDVTVNAPKEDTPAVTCAPDISTVDAGKLVIWKATLKGVNTPAAYNYKFVINNADNGYEGNFGVDGSATALPQSFNAQGQIKATVTVQNSNTNTTTGPVNCTPDVTVNAAANIPALECTANPTSINVGDKVTFTGTLKNVDNIKDYQLFVAVKDKDGVKNSDLIPFGNTNATWQYIFNNAGSFPVQAAVLGGNPKTQINAPSCPNITVSDNAADKAAADKIAADKAAADAIVKAAADAAAKAAADAAAKAAADAAAQAAAQAAAAKAAADAAAAAALVPPVPPPAQNLNGLQQNLSPAQDVISCKMYGNILALDSKGTVIMYCQQSASALISAKIIKGTFDPTSNSNDNVVVDIFTDKISQQKQFTVSWKGLDQYDTLVDPGEYNFVLAGRKDKTYNYDYSIQKVTVLQSAPVVAAIMPPTPPAQAPAQYQAPAANNPQLHLAAPANVVVAQPSQCPGLNYPTDIANHWAEVIIKEIYNKCLLKGYNDGTFKPDQPVTRFEAIKMALASKGIPPHIGCYTANCGAGWPNKIFTDITNPLEGPYIRAAVDAKLVVGIGGNFLPEAPMTRAEAAALVAKLKNIPAKTGCYTANCGAGQPGVIFQDIFAFWQGSYIRPLADQGILHGAAPGKFEPNRPVTRAELAKMLFGNMAATPALTPTNPAG